MHPFHGIYWIPMAQDKRFHGRVTNHKWPLLFAREKIKDNTCASLYQMCNKAVTVLLFLVLDFISWLVSSLSISRRGTGQQLSSRSLGENPGVLEHSSLSWQKTLCWGISTCHICFQVRKMMNSQMTTKRNSASVSTGVISKMQSLHFPLISALDHKSCQFLVSPQQQQPRRQ